MYVRSFTPILSGIEKQDFQWFIQCECCEREAEFHLQGSQIAMKVLLSFEYYKVEY